MTGQLLSAALGLLGLGVLLALAFVVHAWREWRKPAHHGDDEIETEPLMEPRFVVRRKHLLRRMSVAEIEKQEMVKDPLGAAPQLPFGHLHPQWVELRQGVHKRDQIWTFSAFWKPWPWAPGETRMGYVVVRHGKPAEYLLTSLEPEEVKVAA